MRPKKLWFASALAAALAFSAPTFAGEQAAAVFKDAAGKKSTLGGQSDLLRALGMIPRQASLVIGTLETIFIGLAVSSRRLGISISAQVRRLMRATHCQPC